MIRVILPLPPSTNNLYFNLKGGGRAKTQAYKKWLSDVRLVCSEAYSLAGRPKWPDKAPMRLRMRVGAKYTRDVSNTIKPVEDALCAFLPIPDDRYNDDVHAVRCRDCEGSVMVELEPLA